MDKGIVMIEREKETNLLEALVKKISPNWKPNWKKIDEQKFFIMYSHQLGEYAVGYDACFETFGVVYMEESVARKICKYLNSGEFVIRETK